VSLRMFGLLPTDADLLSAYLDNALPASERAALERRLTADPNLRTALDELQRTLVILRAAPQLAPPRDFTLDPARYGRSPATLRASRTNARVWLRWSAAIAAIALIALVGVIVRGINNSRQSTSSGAIAIVPTGMLLTSSTTPLTISTNSLAAKRTESPTLPTVIPSTVMSPTLVQKLAASPALPVAPAVSTFRALPATQNTQPNVLQATVAPLIDAQSTSAQATKAPPTQAPLAAAAAPPDGQSAAAQSAGAQPFAPATMSSAATPPAARLYAATLSATANTADSANNNAVAIDSPLQMLWSLIRRLLNLLGSGLPSA